MERTEFIQWLKSKTNCIIVNDLDRRIENDNLNTIDNKDNYPNNNKNNNDNTK